VWEVTQHLIRGLDQKGEKETANLKAEIGGMAEIARDLAYRLYTLCERKGWATITASWSRGRRWRRKRLS
jgi:putative DNA methylase